MIYQIKKRFTNYPELDLIFCKGLSMDDAVYFINYLIRTSLENDSNIDFEYDSFCEFQDHKHHVVSFVMEPDDRFNIYSVVKSYEGFPSKTIIIEKNTTIDKAQNTIKWIASQWAKHGGLIIEEKRMYCILEEADESNKITYTIVENN